MKSRSKNMWIKTLQTEMTFRLKVNIFTALFPSIIFSLNHLDVSIFRELDSTAKSF